MSTDETQTDSAMEADEREYAESIGKRVLPELHDWFSLKNIFSWLFGFTERYFRSRIYQGALVAVPFFIFGIVSPPFLWWLKEAPKSKVVANYEQAAADAVEDNDDEAAGVYLRSLVRLRPTDKRHRFSLALHLLESGHPQEGISYLQQLIDPGPQGYNAARLWLVRQASRPEPLIPVSEKVVEQQLILVLETDPNSFEANRLMADFYFQRDQFLQAETRLLKIVDDVPQLCLPLVKIQLQLKRSQEQIEFQLSNARRYYQKGLAANPDNDDIRVALAEALEFSNRKQDAVQILSEGIQRNQSEPVKNALSLLYFRTASSRLTQSSVNKNSAAELIVEASKLNPGNRRISVGLLSLLDGGVNLTPQNLEPAIGWLSENANVETDDIILQARLLSAAGRYNEGLAVIAEISEQTPKLKFLQASILRSAKEEGQADEVMVQLINELGQRNSDLNAEELRVFADALIIQNRYQEAYDSVKARLVPVTSDSDSDQNSPLTSIERSQLSGVFVRACIGLFDKQYEDASFTDDNAAMRLLNDALQVNIFTANVLDKLADIATDPENRFSKAADANLAELLATGNATAKVAIYGMLGTRFLARDNVTAAKKNLDRAYSIAPTNEVVLNNLALALVRERPVNRLNVERALHMIEAFLEASPGNADGLSTRGEIFVAMKRWEEARADLERCLIKQPSSKNSHELLITVFEALKEPVMAAQQRKLLQQLESAEVSPE